MGLFTSKENDVLDWLCGSGSPATYDLGVSRTQPAEDGTNIQEPIGYNYARVTIDNNATNFPRLPPLGVRHWGGGCCTTEQPLSFGGRCFPRRSSTPTTFFESRLGR
jgi:hypothetical protein